MMSDCPWYKRLRATFYEPSEHWCEHPESVSGECCEKDCPVKAADELEVRGCA